MLLVRCSLNVACYNFVDFNFLLKEHGFPFQRSQLCILPSCRRQGPWCLIPHTRPLNPATWDAITVTNCKRQPRLIDYNNWALTWHFYDWLCVTVLVCFCSSSLLALIYSLYQLLKSWNMGLLRAGFFLIRARHPRLSIPRADFKVILMGTSTLGYL